MDRRKQIDSWETTRLFQMFASYDKTKARAIDLPDFEKLYARLQVDEILLGKVPME